MNQTVNILGTEYLIRHINYEDESHFEKEEFVGWCSTVRKEIVIGRLSTFPNFRGEDHSVLEDLEKRTLRHEIVHGFLIESGLDVNSLECCEGWAVNEEMVDWFAFQGQKIYKAWEEAGAL